MSPFGAQSRNRGSRKPAGVQFDFESRRNFGLRVRWPVYNARPINCESIRTRRRQILHRDFAHDARRIACPIAHCGFAGEDRAVFCGRGDYDGDDEKQPRKRLGAKLDRSIDELSSQLNRSAVKYRADSSRLP